MARMGGGQAQTRTRNTGTPAGDMRDPPTRPVIPGKPATPPPAAAPKPIATPKVADNSTAASDAYWGRVKEGEAWANDHFAEGSMGRMTDPRQKEMNELLARQKAGMDGLDAKENMAMKEQGQSEINRMMAQNLEKYAGMAGAQGVRGGAAAALQGRAVMEAGQQNADFQRKMILDNVAIKQQAMDRYGSTLGQQQNTELGLQQYNIGQQNAELYGRTTVPFQIAAGIDAQQATMDARSLNDAQLGLGTQQLNDSRQQTWRDEQQAARDKKDSIKAQADAEAAANKGKIICTESFRQGLITEEKWLVTQRYRKLLTMREYKGYLTWAQPVVARMKADPSFARKLLPFVSRMIEAERYALGEIAHLTLSQRAVAVLVKVLNYGGALVRSLSLKMARKQHVKT